MPVSVWADYKTLVVPLPPLCIAAKIRSNRSCLIRLQNHQRKDERQARYLFQSLQQRAFSGELFTEKSVSTPLLTEVAQHV